MNSVHEVVTYIINQPPTTWTTLLSFLGGSTLVASVLQVVKHKFNFAEAEKFVVFVLGFFSFLAAFADFLIQSNPTLSALPWLGHTTTMLVGGAVIVHRFVVSPVYYKLNTKLQGFEKLLEEAETEQKLPVAALPTGTSATTINYGSLPDEANLTQFQI